MSNQATHNLKTYDKQTFALTLDDKRAVDKAMEEGKTFVRWGPLDETGVPRFNVAVKNIASLPPIQRTEADMPRSDRALPAGEYKFNPDGPGYKAFLKAKEELIKKVGVRNVPK